MTDDEKIAVGYAAAIEMINAGGADNWARFDALLVSNSVLLAAVGFVLTEKLRVPVSIWASAGCVLGFVLCLLWGLLIWRGNRYIEYWNAVARELEGRLNGFDLFRRGQLFGRGVEVNVGQGAGAEQLRMRWVASVRSVRWMYVIIGLFAALYVVVLGSMIFAASPWR